MTEGKRPLAAVRTEVEVAADAVIAMYAAKLLRPGSTTRVLSDASTRLRIPMRELQAAHTRWQHRGIVPEARGDRHADTADRFKPDDTPPAASEPPAAATPPGKPALKLVHPDPDKEEEPAAQRRHIVVEIGDELRVAGVADIFVDVDLESWWPADSDAVGTVTVNSHAAKRRRPAAKREERQLCLACLKIKPASRFRVANVDTGRLSMACIPCEDDRSTRSVEVIGDPRAGTVNLTFMAHEGDHLNGVECGDCGAPIKPGELVTGRVGLTHDGCPVAVAAGG